MKRFLILILLLLPISVFAQNNFRTDSLRVIMITPQSGRDTLALRGRVTVRGIFIPDSIYSARYGGVPEAVGGVIGGLRDSVVFLYAEALTNSATSGTLLWLDGDTLKPVTVNGPIQFVNGDLTFNTQMSVTKDGLGAKLLNDQPTPSDKSAYVTVSGVKGWRNDVYPFLVGNNAFLGTNLFSDDVGLGGTDVSHNGRLIFFSYNDEDAAWTLEGDSSHIAGAVVGLRMPGKPTGKYTLATKDDTTGGTVSNFVNQSQRGRDTTRLKAYSDAQLAAARAADTARAIVREGLKVDKTEIYTLPYQIGLGASGITVGAVWPMGKTNGETADTVFYSFAGSGEFAFNIYFGDVTGTASDSLFDSPNDVTMDDFTVKADLRNSGHLGTKYMWFKATDVTSAPTAFALGFKGTR